MLSYVYVHIIKYKVSTFPSTDVFSTGPIALELCHTMVTIATQIPAVLWHLRGEITQQFCDAVLHISKNDGNVQEQDSDNLVVRRLNYSQLKVAAKILLLEPFVLFI